MKKIVIKYVATMAFAVISIVWGVFDAVKATKKFNEEISEENETN